MGDTNFVHKTQNYIIQQTNYADAKKTKYADAKQDASIWVAWL